MLREEAKNNLYSVARSAAGASLQIRLVLGGTGPGKHLELGAT